MIEQVGKLFRLQFVAGWAVIIFGLIATAAAQRPSLPPRPTAPQTVASASVDRVATKAPFTVNHVIKFAPGTERQRAALKKMAVVGGIVDGDFVTANEDLNDDGSKEIIVMSHSRSDCGTGGCATVVLQKRPNGIAVIFEQNVFEPLAVTNEKIGIYRALAIADDKGGIVIGDMRGTPMFGKQLVYPMNGH